MFNDLVKNGMSKKDAARKVQSEAQNDIKLELNEFFQYVKESLMPNVAGKKYPYTAAGKKAAKKKAKSLLTAKQKTLPKSLQEKILKKKMASA